MFFFIYTKQINISNGTTYIPKMFYVKKPSVTMQETIGYIYGDRWFLNMLPIIIRYGLSNDVFLAVDDIYTFGRMIHFLSLQVINRRIVLLSIHNGRSLDSARNHLIEIKDTIFHLVQGRHILVREDTTEHHQIVNANVG